MVYEYLIKRANIVIEALPYLRKFHDQIMVIKYGGAAIEHKDLREKVIQDIVLLKYVGFHPVVIHGGGPEINRALRKAGIETRFIEGLRVTDEKTMETVEKVLSRINKKVVSLINKAGGKGRGLIGKKGRLIKASKLTLYRKGQKIDLGFTGEVRSIDSELLKSIVYKGQIPIISSIGVGRDENNYNINADQAASSIAQFLSATKLIILTDVLGVLSKDGKLISRISSHETRSLIRRGIISGGMIPKVKCALEAIKGGVESSHIIDGRIPHALLLEIFTDHGIGTMVVR